MTKRPRLYLAQSHDPNAQTSIIVLELRGQSSLYWEQVVRREQESTFASPSVQVELIVRTYPALVLQTPERQRRSRAAEGQRLAAE